MIAASFVTLAYWGAFLLVALYLFLLIGQELERRKQIRRMRERRIRRALMDARRPQPWVKP